MPRLFNVVDLLEERDPVRWLEWSVSSFKFFVQIFYCLSGKNKPKRLDNAFVMFFYLSLTSQPITLLHCLLQCQMRFKLIHHLAPGEFDDGGWW